MAPCHHEDVQLSTAQPGALVPPLWAYWPCAHTSTQHPTVGLKHLVLVDLVVDDELDRNGRRGCERAAHPGDSDLYRIEEKVWV